MPKQKYLKAKGIIAAITTLLVLACYVLFTYQYYMKGIKMNDLFFIVTGVGMFIFMGLLFSFFKNIIVKTILLFGAAFYFILIALFLNSLITLNDGYVYSKVSLISGLILGLIYLIYDTITDYINHRYASP